MKQILFGATNERKLGEARTACRNFDIEVVQTTLHIEEIQHRDPLEITKHKVAEAFHQVSRPIVVADTSWMMPALSGFPGGYMKDVAAWFSPEDFIHLLSDKADRRVSFTETIAYKDAAKVRLFSKEYRGNISDSPRGTGNSIEQVAEFDGYTIGERKEQGRFSHEPKDYIWYQFAQWFVATKG